MSHSMISPHNKCLKVIIGFQDMSVKNKLLTKDVTKRESAITTVVKTADLLV